MRWVWVLFLAACGGETAAVDAGFADAGFLDAGPTLVCGDQTCAAGAEFCRVVPVGACAVDAGVCGVGQEPCQVPAGSGCTATRARSCQPSPSGCSGCPCWISSSPCGPTPQSVQCLGARERGYTVECPYP